MQGRSKQGPRLTCPSTQPASLFMLDSYTLRVLLSVSTSGSFSAILGEEGNIQKDPTDFGPAETEAKVRAGSSAGNCDCQGQTQTPCRKKETFMGHRPLVSTEGLHH